MRSLCELSPHLTHLGLILESLPLTKLKGSDILKNDVMCMDLLSACMSVYRVCA